MHRFNSTETTYSFCFFGDITANGSISLGRYQRWGVRTFDHIDHDDSSGHTQESDGGVDDDDDDEQEEEEEEEDRLCAASDLNGTCNADSLSMRVSSLMSNNSYTASVATTTNSNASSSLSTWIGSTSYDLMHLMAVSSIGLFYGLINWYKTTQAGLLNSLDSIIVHRKYELTTIQGRPSLIVWLATTLKGIVKAASLPTSSHINITALLNRSNSSSNRSLHNDDDDEHYYHYQLYADGAVCNKEGDNPSSSIRRATIVHFVCGTYNTIINVTESQVKIDRWIEQSSDPYMMNMHRSIVHGIFPSLSSSSSSSLTTSVMIVLLTESTYSYACTHPISSHLIPPHPPTYVPIRLDRHADTI